jgi:hypothetical protein
MDHVVKKRLEDMARDFHGPAGAIPFERLIIRHLAFFTDLRERGSTWDQIAGLLAEADIRPGDKRRFPAAHLRGVVSRQIRRAESQGRAETAQEDHSHTHDAGLRSQSSSTAQPARSTTEMKSSRARRAAATIPEIRAKPDKPRPSADQSSPVRPSAASARKSAATDADTKSIRAFMGRAARLRRAED